MPSPDAVAHPAALPPLGRAGVEPLVVSAADAARQIRAAVRVAFAARYRGMRVRVTFSGARHAVVVGWVDGPSVDAMRALVAPVARVAGDFGSPFVIPRVAVPALLVERRTSRPFLESCVAAEADVSYTALYILDTATGASLVHPMGTLPYAIGTADVQQRLLRGFAATVRRVDTTNACSMLPGDAALAAELRANGIPFEVPHVV